MMQSRQQDDSPFGDESGYEIIEDHLFSVDPDSLTRIYDSEQEQADPFEAIRKYPSCLWHGHIETEFPNLRIDPQTLLAIEEQRVPRREQAES